MVGEFRCTEVANAVAEMQVDQWEHHKAEASKVRTWSARPCTGGSHRQCTALKALALGAVRVARLAHSGVRSRAADSESSRAQDLRAAALLGKQFKTRT